MACSGRGELFTLFVALNLRGLGFAKWILLLFKQPHVATTIGMLMDMKSCLVDCLRYEEVVFKLDPIFVLAIHY